MAAQITGKTLIDWGYKAGPWFGSALAAANAAQAEGKSEPEIRALIDTLAPPVVAPMKLRALGDLAHRLNIRAEDPDEAANVAAVERHMVELMRVPTVVAGAVMPDACPAGSAPGAIPVLISVHVLPPSCVRQKCGLRSSRRSVFAAAYAVRLSK